ncbi:MAG: Alpha-L-arabinofuranosidase domain [Verrucomicrobiota bacterium]
MPELVSIQVVGPDHVYLRHENFVLHAQKQPKGHSLFEADSSFRMVPIDSGGVRFEASNYPGMFITVNESGSVVLAKGRPVEQSTFVLVK